MSDVAKPDAQNAITHRNVDFLMRWHSFIQSPHSIIQPEGLKKKKVNHSIGGVRGARREATGSQTGSKAKQRQSRAKQGRAKRPGARRARPSAPRGAGGGVVAECPPGERGVV